MVEKTLAGWEFKVKDMSKADFGRLEIEHAEVEITGLMACHAEFGPSQAFKGAQIFVSLHMTIQTAILIKTLTPSVPRSTGALATSSPSRTMPPSPTTSRLRRRLHLELEEQDPPGVLVGKVPST